MNETSKHESVVRVAEPHESMLWNVQRTAEFLAMSPSWVYGAVAAGLIPHVKIGAAIRFQPTSIQSWLKGEPPPSVAIRGLKLTGEAGVRQGSRGGKRPCQ